MSTSKPNVVPAKAGTPKPQNMTPEIVEFPGGVILPGARAFITFKAETPSKGL